MDKYKNIEEAKIFIAELEKLPHEKQQDYRVIFCLEKDLIAWEELLKETLKETPNSKGESRTIQQVKFYYVIVKIIGFFQKSATPLSLKQLDHYLRDNYVLETEPLKFFKKMKMFNRETHFVNTMSLKNGEISVKDMCEYFEWIEKRVIKDHLHYNDLEAMINSYNANSTEKYSIDFDMYKWLLQ